MPQEKKSKPTESKSNPSKPLNQLNSYLKYSALAIQMLAFVLLGVWGGYKLDQVVDTKTPWFTIGLSLLGIAAAMAFLFYQIPRDEQ